MSTPITDYGLGYSKSREDVLFEKFENNSMIIAFARDSNGVQSHHVLMCSFPKPLAFVIAPAHSVGIFEN